MARLLCRVPCEGAHHQIVGCILVWSESLTFTVQFFTTLLSDLTAEQQQLRNIVRKFAAEEITPVAAEYDKTMEFPSDVIKKAHACGLLNSSIPEIYGMSFLFCIP
ncbi:hypothetical protein NECAME_07055 [Necator americanus]|uniref:Acyl-CoA dehydrogenase/oxidase N-terminal domain-containing protein n=1 Tax=Necator americanus TaxID=51031 RepID=W2TSS9_NECAM|nr:hypothetical protein NECAME_07055 [Necator americanus]ETN84107.1 hypothetical protein NECAME_07055 [Necator americanus]